MIWNRQNRWSKTLVNKDGLRSSILKGKDNLK